VVAEGGLQAAQLLEDLLSPPHGQGTVACHLPAHAAGPPCGRERLATRRILSAAFSDTRRHA